MKRWNIVKRSLVTKGTYFQVMIIKDDTKKKVGTGKEAAIEAEVRAARERAVVPLETRMKQFRDLLEEKQISAYSTWEKELHKIVFDPRLSIKF